MLEAVRCCSACSCYCSTIRIAPGNARGFFGMDFGSIHPPESGIAGRERQKVGRPGATNSGSLCLSSVNKGTPKKVKGRYIRKRMDMRGDPQKDR